MNKILLIMMMLMMLVGCDSPTFSENESVTKYTLDKYSDRLIQAQVKFLKCYPEKDGTMRAVYTSASRDNYFPATIRLDYLNKSFNVYFDPAYLNLPKSKIFEDIDACMVEFDKSKEAKTTWK